MNSQGGWASVALVVAGWSCLSLGARDAASQESGAPPPETRVAADAEEIAPPDAGVPGPHAPAMPPCDARDVCVLAPESEECGESCLATTPWRQCCEVACADMASRLVDAGAWCFDAPNCDHPPAGVTPPIWCTVDNAGDFRGPMLRVGVRVGGTASASDYPGGSLLALSGVVGLRLASGFSLIAAWHLAPFGLVAGPSLNTVYVGSGSLEVGFEALVFGPWPNASAGATNWTFSIAATVGVWQPMQCLATNCITGLPSFTLHLGGLNTSGSPYRDIAGFGGLSIVGAVTGAYDPFVDEWMGRLQLSVGFDWSSPL